MKRTFLSLITPLLLSVITFFSGNTLAEIKVVVSIMPIHSLVSGLMSGAGEPYLLLKSNQSPHSMTLKPSDARTLNQADLIVWVGETLESPLAHLIEQVDGDSKTVSLLDIPALHLLPTRSDLDWSHHHHTLTPPIPHAHAHDKNVDNHIWLSPDNARVIVNYLSEVLSRLDPDNRELYKKNLNRLLNRLDTMEHEFFANISQSTDVPFIVFHDAYQYLEDHFGLNAVGSVSISPDRLSGAKHIHQLREKIHRLNARCVFSEPQFQPKLVGTLVSGTPASAGTLDPLGGTLSPGEDAYFKLMQGLSENLASCLSGAR